MSILGHAASAGAAGTSSASAGIVTDNFFLLFLNETVCFPLNKASTNKLLTLPASAAAAAAGPMASLAAASAGASLAGAGAGSESHHGLVGGHHASDTTAFDSYLSKLQVGVKFKTAIVAFFERINLLN